MRNIFLIFSLCTLFSANCQSFKISYNFTAGNLSVDVLRYSDYGNQDNAKSGRVEKPLYWRETQKTYLIINSLMLGFDWPVRKFEIKGIKSSISLSHNITYGIINSPFPGGYRNSSIPEFNNANTFSMPTYIILKKGFKSSLEAEKGKGWGIGVGHNIQFSPFLFLQNARGVIEYVTPGAIYFQFAIDITRPTVYAKLTSEGVFPSIRYRTASLSIGVYLNRKTSSKPSVFLNQ